MPLRTLGFLATFLASALPEAADAQDGFAGRRAEMVAEIAAMARATGSETGRPAFGERVMAAMARVPRHLLVPDSQVPYAYENRPLPIGHGQTISQPYIVAFMTELMDPKATDVVLEVGTGSGYQAAVLAELVAKVYTIEIVEPVGKRAAEALARLGYKNVSTRIGDGYNGWPEAAPFDSIMVTAAAAAEAARGPAEARRAPRDPPGWTVGRAGTSGDREEVRRNHVDAPHDPGALCPVDAGEVALRYVRPAACAVACSTPRACLRQSHGAMGTASRQSPRRAARASLSASA
jgi:protein-L-isoaspartate(D-aspartate) O-methyltransferase